MIEDLKKLLPRLEDHNCRFNDGECECDCYKNVITEVTASLPSLVEYIYADLREKTKRTLETFMWDMDLDEDPAVCIIKNRELLNQKVLKLLTPKE
jgi:hypothetical protein